MLNLTWQNIPRILDSGISLSSSLILAQEATGTGKWFKVAQDQVTALLTDVKGLVFAIITLIVGYLIAWFISRMVVNVLHRTSLDNRLAAWVRSGPEEAEAVPVEQWISTIVFWVIMIFVLVAFFNQLNLTGVSEPLNNFLNQIMLFLPQVGGAAIWLIVAWFLATVVQMTVSRGLQALRLDERLNQGVGTTAEDSHLELSTTLANALYWFIFLLFLPPILEALGLQQALEPIQNLLDQILAALPKILKAVLIGGAGWFLAQVVRRIVTNLLVATGADRLGNRFGMNRGAGSQPLSGIVGTIVYVLILIPVATAALKALEIDAVSEPAIGMLTQILQVIPQIFTATVILIVAYILGQFVNDLVTSILTGLGFNNIFTWLGIQEGTTKAPATPSELESEQQTVIQTKGAPGRTPSELVGIVVLVGIMLFATVTATDVLKLAALTEIVNQIIVIAGRVLFGVIILAIGLYFANLAFHLITSSRTRQSNLLGQAARLGIIIFVGAMALQQMGIASDIVNLAFGLFFGAIAVSIALAFGLGGRDIAAEQIRGWLSSLKDNQNS